MYALNSGPQTDPRYRGDTAEALKEQAKANSSTGLLNPVSACIESPWSLGAMPAY